MLPENKLNAFLELVRTCSPEELIWMEGYLNGLLACRDEKGDLKGQQEAPAKPLVNKITIAYGTETGNSKKVALDFANKAKKSGVQAKLVSLDQYRLNDLQKEEYFFTVISTQGDGEPPAAAKKFYDHIHNNGFKLDKLKYGVLALGDTSYPLFCKTGEEVDEQFNKLGGNRIAPIQKCDVEYEEEANSWFTNVLKNLTDATTVAPAVVPVPVVTRKTGKQIYTGT